MIYLSSLGLVEDIELGLVDSGGNDSSYLPLTLEDIIPSKGLFLGLDISKNSTGITIIEDGKRLSGNISLEDSKAEGVHREVLFRRLLKEYLSEVVGGREFDLIIIEDAFVGENAETVRLLFALNTAIDELIRVSNQSWKSWVYVLDTNRVTKGYKDKEKIRYCLNSIGVFEDGEGYQDRLDSTGLLVGYFLKGKDSLGGTRKKKVRLSDVSASYCAFTDYLFDSADLGCDTEYEYIDCNRITKSKMLELLSDNPSKVFITSNKITLGNLGEDLKLDMYEDRGYFAFWVNRKRLGKYLG